VRVEKESSGRNAQSRMTSEKQRKTYPSQVKATKFPSSCPSATRVPRGDSHPRPFNLAVACSQRLLHRLCRFVHINSIATAKPSCTKSIRTKHTLRTRDFLHLTSPDLTTKPSLRNMSNAPRHNISPPGLSTAIIVAVIISGTVVAVTAMLGAARAGGRGDAGSRVRVGGGRAQDRDGERQRVKGQD
jgi:hypothetical protein